jgi:error-prone DNA polymerase
VLTKLSQADAFGSLGLNRRRALWETLADPLPLPLFGSPGEEEPPADLPEMPPQAEVIADYRTLGMSLRGHPCTFLRPMLQTMRVVPAAKLAELPDGKRLKVAGLVLLRQRPGTASGITFVTLEDETGLTNLIIHPETWERYHRAARTAHALVVHGHLQRQGDIIHVLASKLEDLSPLLAQIPSRSRDFR